MQNQHHHQPTARITAACSRFFKRKIYTRDGPRDLPHHTHARCARSHRPNASASPQWWQLTIRGTSRLHRPPAAGRRSEPRPGGHSNGARGTPGPIDTTQLWGHGTHPPLVRGHRHQRKHRSARRFIVPEGPETPSSMSRRRELACAWSGRHRATHRAAGPSAPTTEAAW